MSLGAALALALSSCAGSKQATGQRMAQGEANAEVDVETLKRAVDAAYERERALAARLAKVEESHARLREEIERLRAKAPSSRTSFGPGKTEQGATSSSGQDSFGEDESKVQSIYRMGLDSYRERRYDDALVHFDKILSMAPYSEWADNAQYWKSECYYGMGKYSQSLIEFAKVFAFSRTEKADDAQLKIARCHLALGEREKALMAFQKLLDEYPDSEYTAKAREEIGYLNRP